MIVAISGEGMEDSMETTANDSWAGRAGRSDRLH
jgi:hypothetical protein